VRLGCAAAFAALLADTAVAGDAARGGRVFERCYACHSVDPAETGLTGPNLAGVVGRRAASRDFDYSPALREAGRRGLVWDEAALDAFLADPASAVPGTSMNFPGLRNEADRRDLIAYLKAAGP
jgi:cytochrome c